MNERIRELVKQATTYIEPTSTSGEGWIFDKEKFAELIVQDCANFVRENYDHEAAESIAWTMEINYGLHGDYA